MVDKGRLVVTGASGFIGTRLVELALDRGWRVTALARSSDRLNRLGNPRLSVLRWSVGEPVGRESLKDTAAVCHLAAFIPPDYSDPAYAEECFRINALGTLALAESAAEARVRRFVLFSSGQIYAQSDQPVSEGDLVYPAHRAAFYLASKLAAELFAEHYREARALPVTILRVASVYGAGMKPEGLISKFAKNAAEGIALKVHNGGRYRADLVHVDDVAGATLSAIERNAGGLFNIGTGVSHSTAEIAQMIVEILGASPKLIDVLPPDGRVPEGFSALDITKARDVLGYLPLDLKDGLRKCLLA